MIQELTIWTISSDLDTGEGHTVVAQIQRELEEQGWEPHAIFGIHLALEEAIVNAIKHGNGCDPTKEVIISREMVNNQLRFYVEDQGPGFDSCAVPNPTDEENLDKSSGRGLMLMRYYMDEVIFNDKGNRVEMTKAFSPALAVVA